jgi:hypothetical protein
MLNLALRRNNMEHPHRLTLNEKVILAAFILQKGDFNKSFTAEDLLIKVWEQDKGAFGLRNHENDYPDSNKLYTKLDGKDGLVRKGLLRKIADRTYILTPVGMSLATSLKPVDEQTKLKVNRELYEDLKRILNHQVFAEWLRNPEKPSKFRDAGWFWGIAPGNPPYIVEERLANIEMSLQEARKKAKEAGGKIVLHSKDINKNIKELLTSKGSTSIDEHQVNIFLDINDIGKCIEFHETLKKRFEKELKIMLNQK